MRVVHCRGPAFAISHWHLMRSARQTSIRQNKFSANFRCLT